jgi:hypothetical protein
LRLLQAGNLGENEMNNLQKAGGISAVIAASTYLFAMALAASLLTPMLDSNLGLRDYMAFLVENKTLVFLWHIAMYVINGVFLTVLVLALYERLKDDAPRLAKVATVFGLFWTAFVFLSGLITLYGTEVLISLYATDQANAANLRLALETITRGIDNSDKLLGCLWVGFVSLSAYNSIALPKAVNVFGLAISAVGLIGTFIPTFVAISYLFGVGAIVWWLWIGFVMLRRHAVVNPVAA